jgi:hypothetical protein
MNKNILIGIIAVIIIGGGLVWAFKSQPVDEMPAINQMPVVTSGENSEPGNTVHELPVEPAAAVARTELATKLSVEEKSIVIMRIEDTTWNDGCLGLGKANESCLQALVPGFRVEMLAQGKTYFYRTDKTGATVRAEEE